MWIDCHAHLYGLDDDGLIRCIDEARAVSVDLVVNTATDLDSCCQVIRQVALSPLLRYTLGISPFEAGSLPDRWQDRLKDLIEASAPVAIGEAGLDDSNPRYPPVKEQLPLFEYQAGLAIEHDLPIVVHSRGAEMRTAALCRSMGLRRVLFHCFTGNREALEAVLEAGYMISLSGIVTFSKASIRELVPSIPPERLMIETDSPYLAPHPHRGKENRPAWVGEVGLETARLIGLSAGKLAEVLRANFTRFFGSTA